MPAADSPRMAALNASDTVVIDVLAAADKVPSVCLDVVAAVDGGVPEADAADDGG